MQTKAVVPCDINAISQQTESLQENSRQLNESVDNLTINDAPF